MILVFIKEGSSDCYRITDMKGFCPACGGRCVVSVDSLDIMAVKPELPRLVYTRKPERMPWAAA